MMFVNFEEVLVGFVCEIGKFEWVVSVVLEDSVNVTFDSEF